jgi:hypothetical protein
MSNAEASPMTLPDLDRHFPRYLEFGPLAPTWCVTPRTDRVIHRFFDSSPISPSGRYLALTRLPYENRLPRPGDVAEIVIVDLETGEQRIVDETRGWDTQLGAQTQWGASDRELLYNDVDGRDWRPYGVCFDSSTGSRRQLSGTIYHVSPDGRTAVSPCLKRTAATQLGYGVWVPEDARPTNHGAASDDGIYVTDIATGSSKLLISLAEIVARGPAELRGNDYARGAFYGAHVKWSPTGDRLMFVLRWLPETSLATRARKQLRRFAIAMARRIPGLAQQARKGQGVAGAIKRQSKLMRPNLLTMRPDGSEIHIALGADAWRRGGHHPNWFPDGQRIVMNLNRDGDGIRFVSIPAEGGRPEILAPQLFGSGHPSMHADGVHLLSDAKPGEVVAAGDGTSPIRLIDTRTSGEQLVARVRTQSTGGDGHVALRVDAHPAWDRSFRRVVFNGFADGTRRVYVSDASQMLK